MIPNHHQDYPKSLVMLQEGLLMLWKDKGDPYSTTRRIFC